MQTRNEDVREIMRHIVLGHFPELNLQHSVDHLFWYSSRVKITSTSTFHISTLFYQNVL